MNVENPEPNPEEAKAAKAILTIEAILAEFPYFRVILMLGLLLDRLKARPDR